MGCLNARASHHTVAVGAAASMGNMLCRPPPKEVMRVEPVKSDGKPPKRNRKVQAVTCQSHVNTAAACGGITPPVLPHPSPPGAGSTGLMGKCLVVSLVIATPGDHSWNQTPWTGLRNLSCTFGESLCWFLILFLPVPRVQESRTCTEILSWRVFTNFEHNQRVKPT